MSVDWHIEPLQRHHDRTRLSCGEPLLDSYLAQRARKHQEQGFSRTFVAVDEAEPDGILGYYSLAAGAFDERDSHPPEEFRHFPPSLPLPVVRLARLAVDKIQQKGRIGEGLLFDAMSRCLSVAENVGIAALAVDAKHDAAKKYYLHYGFKALPDKPLTLWLLLPIIRKLLQSSEIADNTGPTSRPRRLI